MAEVSWIKIVTNIFANRKILYLRQLPDGNNIVLMWIMLLTIAGRCNAFGAIYLTEGMPYTAKILANELKFPETFVANALATMEKLNMIEIDAGYISISGWAEYQSVEGMDRVREQTRKRVAKCREKKKQVGNATPNASVTHGNAEDKNEDKKEEKKEENIDTDPNNESHSRFTPPTLDDVAGYCKQHQYNVDPEAFYDYYTSTGWIIGKKAMTDWKAAVRSWGRRTKDGQSAGHANATEPHGTYL